MAMPDVQNFFHKAIAAHSKKKSCDQKCAVTVECCTQRCYCELVTNVVDNNFQDILYSPWQRYSALGNTRNTFNCSFRQLKQQTSGHNNSSLLGVCDLLQKSNIYASEESYRRVLSSDAILQLRIQCMWSYACFNFFPYKLSLNKNVNALCLYCTDS